VSVSRRGRPSASIACVSGKSGMRNARADQV
jgi:hypothetical protein